MSKQIKYPCRICGQADNHIAELHDAKKPKTECSNCNGVGKIRDNVSGEYWCNSCNGTGKVTESKPTGVGSGAAGALIGTQGLGGSGNLDNSKELDPFDFVQPCEPDCTDERHAYHQGQWDMARRINKSRGYGTWPGAVEEGAAALSPKLYPKPSKGTDAIPKAKYNQPGSGGSGGGSSPNGGEPATLRASIEQILELQKGIPGIKKDAPANQHHYFKNDIMDYETEKTSTQYLNFEDKLNQLLALFEQEANKLIDDGIKAIKACVVANDGDEYFIRMKKSALNSWFNHQSKGSNEKG